MAESRKVKTALSTGTGREAHEDVAVDFPQGGVNRSAAIVGVLEETVPVASFTDGGATVGTYQMQGELPAGAVVLGTKITVPAGFAGDTSATLQVGDGSDADRYHTGTPNVFATAAAGVQSGVPSGSLLLTAANRPTLTVTSAADFTSVVSNGSGIVKVEIYYIETA